MSNKVNQEMEVSYLRSEISSKMEEIINILEENGNSVWPHDEVIELTTLLNELKVQTKHLPPDSEYKTK